MKYDIVIIGGGLVGASLACALADSPFKIALVEARSFTDSVSDVRALVLSYASVNIFSGLGFWPQISSFANPIDQVHISHQGHFGQARFSAKEQGVDAFGYLIKAEVLLNNLRKKVLASKIDVISPAEITGVDQEQLSLIKDGKKITLSAKMCIAADGADSSLRQFENMAVETCDYGQTAIISKLHLERSHQNIAYERFTKKGHIALLPFNSSEYASIWAVDNEQLAKMQNLSDKDYLATMQDNFGYRLGRFASVEKRFYFPLKLTFAKEQVKNNVLLIGNAAHSLHPLAAQGFNLGLRDVAVLAELLSGVDSKHFDVDDVLSRYVSWREQDHKHIKRFTDSNVKLFASEFFPVVLARDLGLIAVDIVPGIKQKIAKLGMGMKGKLPKLALGMPLEPVE